MRTAEGFLLKALIFEKPQRRDSKGYRQTWNSSLLAQYLEKHCKSEGPFDEQRVKRMLNRLRVQGVITYNGDWWAHRKKTYELCEERLGTCPDDTVYKEIHEHLQPTVFELMGIKPDGKYFNGGKNGRQ